MEFLSWHYSKGLNYYINSWLDSVNSILKYFSLPILLRTLFSPWKRLSAIDKGPGINISRSFEAFTFNLISRGIGALVRLILLFAGVVILFMTFVGGFVGVIIWVIFPFFGYNVYKKFKRQPKYFTESIHYKLKSSEDNAIKTIFDNEAGEFIFEHTGISLDEIVENANTSNFDPEKLSHDSYSELVKELLNNKTWTAEFWRTKGVMKKDFYLATQWWERNRSEETKIGQDKHFVPGLARNLLFGYTPVLDRYSVNLSTSYSFERHLIGREEVVSQMERVLSSGQSVALIGQPGVGKKTVVLEFARRVMEGEFGLAMSFRNVYELDYNALLSESHDLNQKKSTLARILDESASAGNIILMIRDIQRLTDASVEGYDFTDVLEGYLGKRDLKIITVTTPQEYERHIAPNMRLRKYLEKVVITPPSKEDAMIILIEAAQRWEKEKSIIFRLTVLRVLLEESDRYITETPFPEKALELLDALVVYLDQRKKTVAEVEDANAILAEKTGISFARLTKEEESKLTKLEDIIHERLINQEAAVSLIAKSLRARSVGVSNEDRPLGTFLFMGPTGVGKTETAKVLAKVYYGSENNIIRFNMAEFSGAEGLERLIGSVVRNEPGALTTAIKNKPASLLLLDEFEKASPQIFNLFLTLLDEGTMNDAFGKAINGRHLFIIGTSNAGAEFIRDLVNQGVKGEELQKKAMDFIMSKELFSPELLNRFDGVVVYEPLSNPDLIKVATLLLKDLAINLRKKGIYLKVAKSATEKIAKDGYDPAFGARPMRRIVNLVIGDIIGSAILSGEVAQGNTIRIKAGSEKNKYIIQKIK